MTIESIRARVEAGTPGPWKRTGTDAKPHWYVSAPDCLVHGGSLIAEPDTVRETTERWLADAAFIAHARQDIPALLAVAAAAAMLLRDEVGWNGDAPFWVYTGTPGYVLRDLRDALAALEALP